MADHDDDGDAAEDQPAADGIDLGGIDAGDGVDGLEPELGAGEGLGRGGHGIASGERVQGARRIDFSSGRVFVKDGTDCVLQIIAAHRNAGA